MDSQGLIRSEILKVIAKKKHVQQGYDQKHFAKDIGIHPSALSAFINGKRRFSFKNAKRYFESTLPNRVWEQIDHQFQVEKKTIRLFKENKDNPEMSEDQYEISADPIHSTLLMLTQTRDFKSDLNWIIDKAEEPREKVEIALARLVRVGLLTLENGHYKQTGARYQATDQVKNKASTVRRARLLKHIAKAVELPIEEKDFYEWICTIDPADVPELKEEIRKIVRQFERITQRSAGKKVYTFMTALFPMTK